MTQERQEGHRDAIGTDGAPSCDFVNGDCLEGLRSLEEPLGIDLLVTSPPYNIGKAYEKRVAIDAYVAWQREVLEAAMPHMSPTGHVCLQVGHYVHKGDVLPLDYVFIPLMRDVGLKLRNRIVWTFGSGLHAKKKFSGRHETILWSTVSDEYRCDQDVGRFNDPLDLSEEGGRHSDVWDDITNVKANHREKTEHPCQYPVGLAERLVLALTEPGDLVVDPFAGVASAGVAALVNGRRFLGYELDPAYHATGTRRLEQSIEGTVRYRPHTMGTSKPKGP